MPFSSAKSPGSPADAAPAAPRALRERSPRPFTVGFYLVPHFPMLAFASAIEPLRAANRLSRQPLFEWLLLSRDGAPVRASNGIDIAVHASISDRIAPDLLLACAGTPDAGAGDTALHKRLRSLLRDGAALGGISLGAYVLAYAGVLDGHRCALHWENLAAFAARFPRIRTTPDIFVIDDRRCTCAGGTAALDMMLQVITDRHGRALAHEVSEQFIHPRIRDMHDPQRMALHSRLGVANEKLVAAIVIMEAADEEPRPIQEIASHVGLSPRQLERLFAKYVRTSPQRFYLKLRLDRARTLLLETTTPILDIAIGCGFASASHFSRCYRMAYGHRPSEGRSVALSGRVTHRRGRARVDGG